jgi:hypothetical protein
MPTMVIGCAEPGLDSIVWSRREKRVVTDQGIQAAGSKWAVKSPSLIKLGLLPPMALHKPSQGLCPSHAPGMHQQR